MRDLDWGATPGGRKDKVSHQSRVNFEGEAGFLKDLEDRLGDFGELVCLEHDGAVIWGLPDGAEAAAALRTLLDSLPLRSTVSRYPDTFKQGLAAVVARRAQKGLHFDTSAVPGAWERENARRLAMGAVNSKGTKRTSAFAAAIAPDICERFVLPLRKVTDDKLLHAYDATSGAWHICASYDVLRPAIENALEQHVWPIETFTVKDAAGKLVASYRRVGWLSPRVLCFDSLSCAHSDCDRRQQRTCFAHVARTCPGRRGPTRSLRQCRLQEHAYSGAAAAPPPARAGP